MTAISGEHDHGMRCHLRAGALLVVVVSSLACLGAKEPACPANTRPCGNGCIPSTGVCCEDPGIPTDQSMGSSYCTNGAGGATDGACFSNMDGRCSAAFPATVTAEWCCAASGDFGSNDCPAGQHHCGLLCTTLPCDSSGNAPDAGNGGSGTETWTGTFTGTNEPEIGFCSGGTFSESGTLTFTVPVGLVAALQGTGSSIDETDAGTWSGSETVAQQHPDPTFCSLVATSVSNVQISLSAGVNVDYGPEIVFSSISADYLIISMAHFPAGGGFDEDVGVSGIEAPVTSISATTVSGTWAVISSSGNDAHGTFTLSKQ